MPFAVFPPDSFVAAASRLLMNPPAPHKVPLCPHGLLSRLEADISLSLDLIPVDKIGKDDMEKCVSPPQDSS